MYALFFIRTFFIVLTVLLSVTYVISSGIGGFNFTNSIIGLSAGLAIGFTLVGIDLVFGKNWQLRVLNITIIGLFVGYLIGSVLWSILNVAMVGQSSSADTITLLKACVFLPSIYFSLILTARAANELHLHIPFIKLKAMQGNKKDLLLDWSVLLDARILDIASSGLLDDHLIVPQFILKEIYIMLESNDEAIRNKAKRCIEIYKKLEGITSLELRQSDIDFPEIKDSCSKLVHLSRTLDANILSADVIRLQPYLIEGTRVINIHMLSNALKPLTGESISIKIQRYGKEPRQGVGYLEDGTMVVVNGGAEFIGEIVKAQVLSVKHTSSGRMIFCNAAEEGLLMDAAQGNALLELDPQKSYMTL